MFIFLAIILLILISIVGTTYRYGIGPTPTSSKVKKELMKALPVLRQGTVYELGAGWGSLSFALADHYPYHQVKAIEVSFIPFLWMYMRQKIFPRKNLKIYYSNFFKKNLVDARLIVCYLYPEAMRKLESKIENECPEATVITHTFAFPGRQPYQITRIGDLYKTPLYIYKGRNV